MFIQNTNLRDLIPLTLIFHRTGVSSTIFAIRYSLNFYGTNILRSNFGGGINVNRARLNVQGSIELYDHHGGDFGGAIRLGELTLVSSLDKHRNIAVPSVSTYKLRVQDGYIHS